MAGVNKVILVGNLGRDPEVSYTGTGTPVARLNLATTRTYQNKQQEKVEETEWHRISVWGKQAENCQKYLSKGRQVYIEGRLRTSEYEQDGVKKYSTEIVANIVQFLGGGSGGGGGAGGGGGPSSSAGQMPLGGMEGGGSSGGPSSGGGFAPPNDDDIPF
jgi:single-strand DNA-binding protein